MVKTDAKQRNSRLRLPKVCGLAHKNKFSSESGKTDNPVISQSFSPHLHLAQAENVDATVLPLGHQLIIKGLHEDDGSDTVLPARDALQDQPSLLRDVTQYAGNVGCAHVYTHGEERERDREARERRERETKREK